MEKSITLNEFIIHQQAEFPEATGNFSCLLHHIGIAAKKVNREVNKAGLVDILGRSGCENVQGEEQQKLDVYANEAFMEELQASGECCGIASEENEDVTTFHEGLCRNAKYIVCMDPLDGSSNIDVNVSVGTIFSIYRRKSPIGEAAVLDDFLQKGSEMVAAGYIIYGSSTMLVYTVGRGVNGFTLDEVKDNKDAWIIKPADDYGAHGVYPGVDFDQARWERIVDENLDAGYIVQEFYQPPRVDIINTVIDDDDPCLVESWQSMPGVYLYGGEPVGFYCRLGNEGVIAIDHGGLCANSFAVD